MTSVRESTDIAADIAAEEKFLDERGFEAEPVAAPPRRSGFRNWLLEDSPYIAMLLLVLVGVTVSMPGVYWVMLTPVFGIICVVAGWRHFETREARLELAYTQALSWFALILSIYVLYSNVVQGILNENSTSLAMMTLLALGTFTGGLHARVWRICAVGAIVLLAVPGVGWLHKSAVLMVIATLVVIAAGAATWWVDQRRRRAV
jgi:hypothetical protein